MAGELNIQLQQLEARVKTVETGLVAHHQALSQVTTALLANPYTASVGAVSAVFYNYLPGTFQVLMGLASVTMPEFDTILQNIATGLINEITEEIENIIDSLVEKIEQTIAEYTKMLNDVLKEIEDINKKLTTMENDLAKTLDAKAREEKLKEIEQTKKEKAQKEVKYTSIQDTLTTFKKITPTDIEKAADFILGQTRLKMGKSSSITFDGL